MPRSGNVSYNMIGRTQTPSDHQIIQYHNKIEQDITALPKDDPDYAYVKPQIRWDPGGLFGCCSGDAGVVKGTCNMLYAISCAPCAASGARKAVYRVRHMEASVGELNQDINTMYTDSNQDNFMASSGLADILQENFDDQEVGTCTVMACYPCTINWMVRTTDNFKRLIESVHQRREQRANYEKANPKEVMKASFRWSWD